MLGQKQLLQFDNKCSLGERIINFGTKMTLTILADTDTWFTDGNFGLVSTYPRTSRNYTRYPRDKNDVFVVTTVLFA